MACSVHQVDSAPATTLEVVQVLIVIVIVIVLVVAIGVVVAMRREPSMPERPSVEPATTAHTPAAPEAAPMSDLESALSKVTDSAGRPIKDHIDAETDHVDELRVADDTGPLLRRALDHVAKPDDDTPLAAPHDGSGEPPTESAAPPAN